jgi:drug/metabolite transporter (DMT)-like permease
MDPQLPSIVFGLLSASSWGAGDFCGGIATRQSNVYRVVIVSQLFGGLLLLGLALLLAEPVPQPSDLLLGALAGLAGGLGLTALYQGLAHGRMGVVAPVAAVVSAAMSVAFGTLVEGLANWMQLGGFAFALLAVWLSSGAGDKVHTGGRDLALPVAAGLGFGLFLILIGHVSDTAVFWPLLTARGASLVMLLAVAMLGRRRPSPAREHLGLIALTALFDTGGNACFALAAQAGRLDIAAILASLYPAGTVLLARYILREQITRRQWAGVAAALAAVTLIAV